MDEHRWQRASMRNWERPYPFAERLVGGYEHRPARVTSADQLEQHDGLGLILGDVGDVRENHQVEAVEPINYGFEVEFAARELELLHRIGDPGEANLSAVLDKARPITRWLFPASGRPSNYRRC
jgi:hypothetical protein